MGARLVAASVPIYALGVAYAVFLGPFKTVNDGATAVFAGGLVALLATITLATGAAALRSRRAGRIAGAVVTILVAAVIASAVVGLQLFDRILYAYYVLWLVLAPLFLLSYLTLFRVLWVYARPATARALERAAPFALAVLLAPLVFSPRYWPDATYDRSVPVYGTALIVALIGALGLLAGIPALRVSVRTSVIALAALAAVQFGLIVRGLPNPPMALAVSAPLTLEYPRSHAELADDVDVFRDRLTSIVRRSGVRLPPSGVYARYRWYEDYRWHEDPADLIPPSEAVLVTLVLIDLADLPDERSFAREAARSLVPEPKWNDYDKHSPWQGYSEWLLSPEDRQLSSFEFKSCYEVVFARGLGSEVQFVPYLRAERNGGLEAARALFDRLMSAPPTFKEWQTLLATDCRNVMWR
jgi:hypothetical protein